MMAWLVMVAWAVDPFAAVSLGKPIGEGWTCVKEDFCTKPDRVLGTVGTWSVHLDDEGLVTQASFTMLFGDLSMPAHPGWTSVAEPERVAREVFEEVVRAHEGWEVQRAGLAALFVGDIEQRRLVQKSTALQDERGRTYAGCEVVLASGPGR